MGAEILKYQVTAAILAAILDFGPLGWTEKLEPEFFSKLIPSPIEIKWKNNFGKKKKNADHNLGLHYT